MDIKFSLISPELDDPSILKYNETDHIFQDSSRYIISNDKKLLWTTEHKLSFHSKLSRPLVYSCGAIRIFLKFEIAANSKYISCLPLRLRI